MAIGSPAICAYRLFNSNEVIPRELSKKVFVSLFNKAESSAVLDLLYGRKGGDSYYENVFRYCVAVICRLCWMNTLIYLANREMLLQMR